MVSRPDFELMPSNTVLSAQQADSSSHQLADVLADWKRWQLLEHAPQPNQLRPLCGGLTNQSWLLAVDNQCWVIRINAANSSELDIQRDNEYRIQQLAAAAGLAPEVLYRCPKDIYWITEYLEGPSLRDVLKKGQMPWLDIQHQLGRLHALSCPADLDSLDVAAKAAVYWQGVRQKFGSRWNTDWQQLQQMIQQQLITPPGPQRALCHMDPNPDNWKHVNGSWMLIDWEYATVGHPLWDLANLVLMSELSPAEQAMLLVDLGIDPGAPDWQQANRQLGCLNALWYGAQGLWSVTELRGALAQD